MFLVWAFQAFPDFMTLYGVKDMVEAAVKIFLSICNTCLDQE